eukprot:NODE_1678_length_1849_cov_90.480301_g1423_i0.p1 GENE.NODE_1678_length_1849_cov_90.480301_g1423_i0~~NODE_1678_length_1849_cov_90.480301_g1423_i0.p1  ORF type:complete len:580 (-),score=136.95 NODE_1678_length_1849_cov_90.480301_g1423_i0:110-1807(-)
MKHLFLLFPLLLWISVDCSTLIKTCDGTSQKILISNRYTTDIYVFYSTDDVKFARCRGADPSADPIRPGESAYIQFAKAVTIFAYVQSTQSESNYVPTTKAAYDLSPSFVLSPSNVAVPTPKPPTPSPSPTPKPLPTPSPVPTPNLQTTVNCGGSSKKFTFKNEYDTPVRLFYSPDGSKYNPCTGDVVASGKSVTITYSVIYDFMALNSRNDESNYIYPIGPSYTLNSGYKIVNTGPSTEWRGPAHTWVWHQEVCSDTLQRNAFISFAKTYNIVRAYLESQSLITKNLDKLNECLTVFQKNGIEIELLFGDSEWISPEGQPVCLDLVDRSIALSKSRKQLGLGGLAGLHLDVEAAGNKNLWPNLLVLMKKVAQKLDNYKVSNVRVLPLTWDVPFDMVVNEVDCFGSQQIMVKCASQFLDIVGFMGYRNSAEEAARLASQLIPQVGGKPIVLGSETDCVAAGSEAPVIAYCGSKGSMNVQIQRLSNWMKEYYPFTPYSLAIHHYGSWLTKPNIIQQSNAITTIPFKLTASQSSLAIGVVLVATVFSVWIVFRNRKPKPTDEYVLMN